MIISEGWQIIWEAYFPCSLNEKCALVVVILRVMTKKFENHCCNESHVLPFQFFTFLSVYGLRKYFLTTVHIKLRQRTEDLTIKYRISTTGKDV